MQVGVKCKICSHPELQQINAMCLEPGHSLNDIAQRFGFSRDCVHRHRTRHLPKALTRAASRATAKAEDRLYQYDIARKEARVAALNDLHDRVAQVIRERGADPAMASIPGGGTGLLVTTYKRLGQGDDAETVREYRVDVATVAEARHLQEQAARELGQWEPQQQGDRSNVPFLIVMPAAGISSGRRPVEIDIPGRMALPAAECILDGDPDSDTQVEVVKDNPQSD